ncbi:hypothetical protein IAU59_002625 [Kwoniella sp. CBS 9459]
MSSTATATATASSDAKKRPRQSSIDHNNRDTKRRKDGSKKAPASEGGNGKAADGVGDGDGSTGNKVKRGEKEEGKSWVANQIESMEKLYKEVLVQAAMIFQHQAFSKRLGLQDKVPLHMMHRLEITWRTCEAFRRQTEQCMAQPGSSTATNTSTTAPPSTFPAHAKLVPSLHKKPTSTSTLSALSSLATSGEPPKTIDLPIPSHLAINLDNLRSASPIPMPIPPAVGTDGIADLDKASTSAPVSATAAASGSAVDASASQPSNAGNQAQAHTLIAQQAPLGNEAQDQIVQMQGGAQGNVGHAGQGEGASRATSQAQAQAQAQDTTTSTVPLSHSHPLSTESAVQLPPVHPVPDAQMSLPLSATQALPQAQSQQLSLLQSQPPQFQSQPQLQAQLQAPPQPQGVMETQGDVDYSTLGLAELSALINGDSFDPLSMGLPIPDTNQQALDQAQSTLASTLVRDPQQLVNIGFSQQQQPQQQQHQQQPLQDQQSSNNLTGTTSNGQAQAQTQPNQPQQQSQQQDSAMAEFDFAQAFGSASAGTEGDFSALAGLFPSSMPDFGSANGGDATLQTGSAQDQNQNQNQNQGQNQNQNQYPKEGDSSFDGMFSVPSNAEPTNNGAGQSRMAGDTQQQSQAQTQPLQSQQQNGTAEGSSTEDQNMAALLSFDSDPPSQAAQAAAPSQPRTQQQQQQQQSQTQPQPQAPTQSQSGLQAQDQTQSQAQMSLDPQSQTQQPPPQQTEPQVQNPIPASVPDCSQAQGQAQPIIRTEDATQTMTQPLGQDPNQYQTQNLIDTQSANEQFGDLGPIDMSEFDFTDAGMGMDLNGDEFERLMAEF